MTTKEFCLRIGAGTMAAMMLTVPTLAADGGSGTAELTLELTPLGPVSPGSHQQQIAFSPDRHRAAVIATQGSRQTVMVDGHAGPLFSKIVTPAMGGQRAYVTFSPDNESFTYVGDPDGTQQVVVTDGKQGPGYDRVLWLRYSPTGHRLAYAAEKKPAPANGQSPAYQPPEVTVVVDGKPGPAFSQIKDTSGQDGFRFSPDGRRFAYVALARIKTGQFNQTQNSYHVMVDGVPSSGYHGISGLKFSPDSGSIAYIVQTSISGNDYKVVVDGKEGSGYRSILPSDGSPNPRNAAVIFSGDGQHFAYIAAKSPEPKGKITGYVLVVDGQEVAHHDAPSHGGSTIQQATLSPDGQRWAYVGLESGGQSYGAPNKYIYVDGQKSSNYTDCSGIVFSPDSRHVASIVTNANRKQFLIYDGRESEPYVKIPLESLRFSPDSNRFAYVAQRDRDWVAVVDGLPGPAHRSIDPKSLRFSDDGRHFSYTVAGQSSKQGLTVVDHEVRGSHAISSSDGTKSVHVDVQGAGTSSVKSTIILNGKPYGPTFGFVDQLQMSPDGQRVAAIGTYTGTSGKKLAHLFIDGQEGPETFGIKQLKFTPDSKHVVYVDEVDRTRTHQVVIDGQSIAQFDQVIMQRTFDPHTNQSGVEGGLGFLPDGTLEFFATRGETIYRVRLSNSGLDDLPSLEQSVAATPGPRLLLGFKAHSKEAGEPGNLVIGPDGTLYATASRGGKYKQGFLFRTKPDGSEMQVLYNFLGNQTDGSRPTALVYGPDDELYGLLSQGGKERTGSIFKVKTDGSGFATIHHFDSRSRQPELISVEPDGAVYGLVADPVRLFRVAATGGEYTVVYESVTERDRGYLESDRDQLVDEIAGLKKMLENFKEYPDTQSPERVKTYEESLREQQMRLVEVTEKLTMHEIGPMIDGGDGFFYGTTQDVIFKLKKSNLEFARLHTFEGPPLDGKWPRTAPMAASNGRLYGLTSMGGISNGGVIYRIKRDGSDYRVVFNPDTRVQSYVNPVEAPDGTVYAVFPSGLHRIENEGTAADPTDPFVGYARAENLQFVGPDLYGVAKSGNGQGQIFRYVLPTAGSSSGSGVAVNENTKSPPPLIVPSDSPDPSTDLFANTTLPDPATPTSSQKTESGIVKTDTTQANQPASGEPATAEKTGDPISSATETAETTEETDKTPSGVEKATEQVEETAKKAKKLFKSFGF